MKKLKYGNRLRNNLNSDALYISSYFGRGGEENKNLNEMMDRFVIEFNKIGIEERFKKLDKLKRGMMLLGNGENKIMDLIGAQICSEFSLEYFIRYIEWSGERWRILEKMREEKKGFRKLGFLRRAARGLGKQFVGFLIELWSDFGNCFEPGYRLAYEEAVKVILTMGRKDSVRFFKKGIENGGDLVKELMVVILGKGIIGKGEEVVRFIREINSAFLFEWWNKEKNQVNKVTKGMEELIKMGYLEEIRKKIGNGSMKEIYFKKILDEYLVKLR